MLNNDLHIYFWMYCIIHRLNNLFKPARYPQHGKWMVLHGFWEVVSIFLSSLKCDRLLFAFIDAFVLNIWHKVDGDMMFFLTNMISKRIRNISYLFNFRNHSTVVTTCVPKLIKHGVRNLYCFMHLHLSRHEFWTAFWFKGVLRNTTFLRFW